MKTIEEWLKERESEVYVGRAGELLLMKQLLLYKQEDWFLLYFHGPQGVGKTMLLKQFERTIQHVPVLYIDGQNGMGSKTAFLEAVRKQLADKHYPLSAAPDIDALESLNQLADAYDRVILLFDGLDNWTGVDQWLQSEWLPRLSFNIRVAGVGNQPLLRWLSSPIWNKHVIQEALGPYDRPSAEQDKELGVERLDADGKRLLQAAAILKYFDRDALAAMLDAPVTEDEFRRFCRLPFVKDQPDRGWTLVEQVRREARANFRNQEPARYDLCRARAEQFLNRCLGERCPDGNWFQHELAWRKFSLLDNDFIQGMIFYGDDDGFSLEPAKATDIPRLENMHLDNIQAFDPSYHNETHLHTYLRALWEVAGDGIKLIVRERAVVGFYALIPLNEQARFIIGQNPIFSAFIELGSVESNDYLVWMVASSPPFDPDVYGYGLRELLFNQANGKRIAFMIPATKVMKDLCAIGFENLEWAYYQSAGNSHAYICQLDLRAPKPLPILFAEKSKLSRQDLSTGAIIRESAQQPIGERAEWIAHTKRLLTDFRSLDSPAIRNVFLEQYRIMAAGKTADRAMAQILQHAFLHKKGTHKEVASLLNLSIATYYRYLKQLTLRMAEVLGGEQNQEQ